MEGAPAGCRSSVWPPSTEGTLARRHSRCAQCPAVPGGAAAVDYLDAAGRTRNAHRNSWQWGIPVDGPGAAWGTTWGTNLTGQPHGGSTSYLYLPPVTVPFGAASGRPAAQADTPRVPAFRPRV